MMDDEDKQEIIDRIRKIYRTFQPDGTENIEYNLERIDDFMFEVLQYLERHT